MTNQEQAKATPVQRIGLVVHPKRDIDHALTSLRAWAAERGIELGQIPLDREIRQVAEPLSAERADLVLAIGGDGTTLAAIRSAADHGKPVLGLACGSLGVLTSVPANHIGEALTRFCSGQWSPRRLPALLATATAAGEDDGAPEATDAAPPAALRAFNDIVVVRRGEGQIRVRAEVDGELYARFAGDGCIVATPLGSSAYTLAAGGPLLPLELPAFVLTPLPAHGGFRPPLIMRGEAELKLEITSGFGGARVEVDGQLTDFPAGTLSIRRIPAGATVVALEGEERLLTGLRRRGIIADSPRIVAEDARRANR